MFGWIKSVGKKNKIRKRLLFYFMMATVLMGLASFYTYYSINMLIVRMNATFISNVLLSEISNNIQKVDNALENYLATKNSQNLEDYYKYSEELKMGTAKLKNSIFYGENNLMAQDIKSMIDSYVLEAEGAIKAKRGRSINEYIFRYNEAKRIFKYVNIYIDKLSDAQFNENTAKYIEIAGNVKSVELINIAIIIVVISISVLLIMRITYKITNPLLELSNQADEISKGNFDVKKVDIRSHDEIGITANAFNRMVESIRNYICEINEKAEITSRLKEQEMQNILMKNHLKEAQLHALQSQINPHFLFNTLNAAVQLAMLENADRTSDFIENIATMFRYNLRKLEGLSTVEEEINNIKSYMHILKTRFGSRLEFVCDIKARSLSMKMPSMILQPLIENAFIHGISDLESGGMILLKVVERELETEIIVEDNGKGMSQKTIDTIFESSRKYGKILQTESFEKEEDEPDSSKEKKSSKSGHTTGIGLENVISRMRIYSGREDAVMIESEIGRFTRIILLIAIPDEKYDERKEDING